MLRDRGTIKWTAMMLPEHVEAVKEYMESTKKVKKPELDPQAFEEIERIVCEAMENNSLLAFTYWEGTKETGLGDFKTLLGTVHYIDVHGQAFRIVDHFDERFYLPFIDIIDVRIAE